MPCLSSLSWKCTLKPKEKWKDTSGQLSSCPPDSLCSSQTQVPLSFMAESAKWMIVSIRHEEMKLIFPCITNSWLSWILNARILRLQGAGERRINAKRYLSQNSDAWHKTKKMTETKWQSLCRLLDQMDYHGHEVWSRVEQTGFIYC